MFREWNKLPNSLKNLHTNEEFHGNLEIDTIILKIYSSNQFFEMVRVPLVHCFVQQESSGKNRSVFTGHLGSMGPESCSRSDRNQVVYSVQSVHMYLDICQDSVLNH